jgi:hypothetical protein
MMISSLTGFLDTFILTNEGIILTNKGIILAIVPSSCIIIQYRLIQLKKCMCIVMLHAQGQICVAEQAKKDEIILASCSSLSSRKHLLIMILKFVYPNVFLTMQSIK